MQKTYTTVLSTSSGLPAGGAGAWSAFFWAERTKQSATGRCGKVSHVKPGSGQTIRRKRPDGVRFWYSIKKGGETMKGIIHAYADSLWQEMTEFVNAFVILYKAEVI